MPGLTASPVGGASPLDDGSVVIGVDAGTTSTKAVAVDLSGHILAISSSDEIETSDSEGRSEQDPEDIWAALSQACNRLPAVIRASVSAVCLAAQSGSVIPADVTGKSVGPAITWMDSRAKPIVEQWTSSQRALIRATTGWMPSPGLGLATIAWMHQQPDQVELAATNFRSVDDYLLQRLCGQPVTNPSNAAGMQLMDIKDLAWNEKLCQLAGIERSQLSEIVASGTQAGQLNPNAAKATGLPEGSPIIVGGHDQACAGLSLGAIGSTVAASSDARASSTVAVLSVGTAWVLTSTLKRDHKAGLADHKAGLAELPGLADLPGELNLSPHGVAPGWSLSQNIGGLGAVVSWLREWWDESGHHSLPNHPFFIPALGDEKRTSWGHFVNPSITEGVAELTTERIAEGALSDAARAEAVLEACAFEVRGALETAQTLNPELSELILVGGGTRSARLIESIAAATKMTVIVKADAPWPALGAAQLALNALKDQGAVDAEVMLESPAALARVEPPPTDSVAGQTQEQNMDRRYEQYCQLVSAH